MVALYRAGYEVVLTQRVTADQPRFKRWTSTGFYRLLSVIGDTRIIAGSADYRLVSRPVLEALREMREYHRFLRGMVAWAGYRTVVLPYAERARIGGQAKYSLRGMARLAADATFSFSLVPLRIALVVGLGFPDVHDPDRGRRSHDCRRIGGHLRRLHLPGGQASPGLPAPGRFTRAPATSGHERGRSEAVTRESPQY